MNQPDINELLRTSHFWIDSDEYLYTKLKSMPQPDDCKLIFQDNLEITAVVATSRASKVVIIEKNPNIYKLLQVRPSLPFYAVGFIAHLTSAIAAKGANVLVISTYSADYMCVRLEQLDLAITALQELGLTEVTQ